MILWVLFASKYLFFSSFFHSILFFLCFLFSTDLTMIVLGFDWSNYQEAVEVDIRGFASFIFFHFYDLWGFSLTYVVVEFMGFRLWVPFLKFVISKFRMICVWLFNFCFTIFLSSKFLCQILFFILFICILYLLFKLEEKTLTLIYFPMLTFIGFFFFRINNIQRAMAFSGFFFKFLFSFLFSVHVFSICIDLLQVV